VEQPLGKLGDVMFFLLRMAFWLGVVCVLLPGGGKTDAPAANIDTTQALTLAGAAVSDMRGFCDRQPDACVTGGKVAVAIGQKAEAGARTIYDFVTTKLAEKSTPAEKPAATEKLAGKPAPVVARGPVQGTLTSADLTPAWHAPVPLPPRREARNGKPSA
jgi:hypothetical protein